MLVFYLLGLYLGLISLVIPLQPGVTIHSDEDLIVHQNGGAAPIIDPLNGLRFLRSAQSTTSAERQEPATSLDSLYPQAEKVTYDFSGSSGSVSAAAGPTAHLRPHQAHHQSQYLQHIASLHTVAPGVSSHPQVLQHSENTHNGDTSGQDSATQVAQSASAGHTGRSPTNIASNTGLIRISEPFHPSSVTSNPAASNLPSSQANTQNLHGNEAAVSATQDSARPQHAAQQSNEPNKKAESAVAVQSMANNQPPSEAVNGPPFASPLPLQTPPNWAVPPRIDLESPANLNQESQQPGYGAMTSPAAFVPPQTHLAKLGKEDGSEFSATATGESWPKAPSLLQSAAGSDHSVLATPFQSFPPDFVQPPLGTQGDSESAVEALSPSEEHPPGSPSNLPPPRSAPPLNTTGKP